MSVRRTPLGTHTHLRADNAALQGSGFFSTANKNYMRLPTSSFFSFFFRIGGPSRLLQWESKLSLEVFFIGHLEFNSSSTFCRWN